MSPPRASSAEAKIEQLEGEMDIGRLQGRIRDCSEFLKLARDLVIPEDPGAEKLSLAEVIARLRGGPGC